MVDDEPAIRHILAEILTVSGHEVETAIDGEEGLQKALAEPWDLVLSDISMPHRNGIELLEQVALHSPATHRVLLTGHTLEEFIGQLQGTKISCVLTKSVPFPVQEIMETVNSLLERRIFGIERHVAPSATRERHCIHCNNDIGRIAEEISLRADPRRRVHLCTILNEILTNAVYYGARNEPGDAKESWDRAFDLEECEAVLVDVAEDTEKIAIAVTDRGGRLNRETVLHWLHRQVTRDENGLPLGIFDNHGRGFYISRSFSDRLSISIERGKRCEVTLVLWKGKAPLGEKPLVVLEI
ncbi:MAG: response regulator [Fibrobacteria bacterium]|nr:response regulator [Fibrobacteria bacterium]